MGENERDDVPEDIAHLPLTSELYRHAQKVIDRKRGPLGFVWRPYYSTKVAVRQLLRGEPGRYARGEVPGGTGTFRGLS